MRMLLWATHDFGKGQKIMTRELDLPTIPDSFFFMNDRYCQFNLDRVEYWHDGLSSIPGPVLKIKLGFVIYVHKPAVLDALLENGWTVSEGDTHA